MRANCLHSHLRNRRSDLALGRIAPSTVNVAIPKPVSLEELRAHVGEQLSLQWLAERRRC
jgi:hypothetical protein